MAGIHEQNSSPEASYATLTFYSLFRICNKYAIPLTFTLSVSLTENEITYKYRVQFPCVCISLCWYEWHDYLYKRI